MRYFRCEVMKLKVVEHEFIEEPLVRYLLVHNSYLNQTRHCMTIIAHCKCDIFICHNSTFQKGAKTHERVPETSDISLYKLKVVIGPKLPIVPEADVHPQGQQLSGPYINEL